MPGKAGGIDEEHSAGLASVAAGEDVELDAAGLQQFAEHDHEGSFAAATGRKIANTDYRSLQAMGAKQSAIVERVARCYDASVDG